MPKFIIGERVKRIEEREITGAVVLEVVDAEYAGFFYHIEYDEGHTGWWSEDNLEKE